jgi:hypothetical protein
MSRAAALALLLSSAAASLGRAQEFTPPDRRGAPAASPPAQSAPAPAATGGSAGFQFGLLGFSSRGGWQVNKESQGIIGTTVDIAQLGSPYVRLRPSVEFGIGGAGANSIGVNAEVLYRFQPDNAPAVPYVGLGVGYYDDRLGTKSVWPTVVMGFELPLARSFNWLIEYHALDTLRRSRFLIGLATRGGS